MLLQDGWIYQHMHLSTLYNVLNVMVLWL